MNYLLRKQKKNDMKCIENYIYFFFRRFIQFELQCWIFKNTITERYTCDCMLCSNLMKLLSRKLGFFNTENALLPYRRWNLDVKYLRFKRAGDF